MPKTLSFQLFVKTNKMRKFYYKEKKMEIKQKHGKHALRKAVTAAVLAGTAFSSLGGFAGAVTTVKADINNPKLGSIETESLMRLSHDFNSRLDVSKLRDEIQGLSTESLHALLVGLDPAHAQYNKGIFELLSRSFSMMENDNVFDWLHNDGLGLASILIQEVRNRLDIKDKLGEKLSEQEEKLKELVSTKEKLSAEKENLEGELREKKSVILKKESELKDKENELTYTLKDLYRAEDTIEKQKAKVKDLTEKLETSKKNHAELAEEFEKTKGEYEKELSENDKKLSEAAKQNSDLVTENKELKENLEMAEGISDDLQKKVMKAEQEVKELSAQLEAEQEALEAEKAKLAESEKENAKLTEERDVAKKEAEKVPELEEQVEKLVEEITAAKKEAEELQAKAEGLEKDFEAVKAEKEALEAEIAKLKEDHQKEVDALNALLADKEKMLKSLQDRLDKAKEEAMKNEQMSQEEKAKLQAELDKAKQELAEKIKDMPNKVAPQAEGKANAGQAAPNQNQNNQAQANQTKNGNNLPSTGDKPVNPLLVASGLSLMIGAGAFVYAGKRKKG